MGSLVCMKIDREDYIPLVVKWLRRSGRRVFAAALNEDACVLGKEQIKKSDCVLIGNEGHGLSDEAIDACDSAVFIPMKMDVESLNASVAASVLLWEFFGRN